MTPQPVSARSKVSKDGREKEVAKARQKIIGKLASKLSSSSSSATTMSHRLRPQCARRERKEKKKLFPFGKFGSLLLSRFALLLLLLHYKSMAAALLEVMLLLLPMTMLLLLSRIHVCVCTAVFFVSLPLSARDVLSLSLLSLSLSLSLSPPHTLCPIPPQTHSPHCLIDDDGVAAKRAPIVILRGGQY